MLLTLADVPEEILERILALTLVQSPEPSPRPSWHAYKSPSPSNHPSVISPLLVCRDWLRIATPIHYRHPVLRTPRHADLLLRALRYSPSLGQCVRSLHLHATSPALRGLIPLCPRLDTLDITVDNGETDPAVAAPQADAAAARPRSVIDFCDAFTKTRSIRHLVIRKNAYLTQPNACFIYEQLGKAIPRWHRLESVNVAFRLCPSPAANALVQALTVAPRLHTLCTQLPVVWNNLLLEIAMNSSLARIVLFPASELSSAHLYLAEAKRHPRLLDLLRAGMPPPTPRGAMAFVAGGNARARASSAVVAGKTPVPVATWGYERDVPAPICPPMPRAGPATQSMPGLVVNRDPSAFYPYHASAPVPATPSHAAQYPPQYNTTHHPSANHSWQAHAYGLTPVMHTQGRGVHAQQGPVAGVPPTRRNAPSGRRMTAS